MVPVAMMIEKEQVAVRSEMLRKFLELQERNPQFSLRAFSRKLNVEAGALSRILNGKRRISKKIAERFCKALMLDPTETASMLSHFSNSENLVSKGQVLDPDYLRLTADQFRIASDWYYFAILSLVRTKDFSPDLDWIADRLGIGLDVTRNAVERLFRMGLIKKTTNGKWVRTKLPFLTSDDIQDLSIRKSHLQTLDLAKASVEKDPVSIRDFTSVTMAIDPKKIAEAKVLIRKFQDDLDILLEKKGQHKTEVYRMMVGLFPLTKIREKKI